MIRAAGILIVDTEGKALFLKRGNGSDYPGMWCVPGGRLEEGEDAITAACRETMEEAGYKVLSKQLRQLVRSHSNRETTGAQPTPPPNTTGYTAALPAALIADIIDPNKLPKSLPGEATVISGEQVDFTTYLLKGAEQFIPKLGPVEAPEHVGFCWAPVTAPPEPLHPGVRIALARLDPAVDEFTIAEWMRDGKLCSPQEYENLTLFDMRITGTDLSYRAGLKEYVWRDPSLYLTERFLKRCNGLPVIWEHPKTNILNSKEFSDRIVGMVVLPYFKGNEVWGIARLYDAAAIKLMIEKNLSTSPAVVWRGVETNTAVTLEDGDTLLIEGVPHLICHLAVVAQGVWDKGMKPSGIESGDAGDMRFDTALSLLNGIRIDLATPREFRLDATGFEKGSSAIAQRMVNAENGMIQNLLEIGGLSSGEARKAFDVMKKAGAFKMDAVNGRYLVKHGAYMDKIVIRRAAGLE